MGCTKVEKTFSPQFFKRWIAVATSNKSPSWQRINITEINYAIRWIEIYPVDSAIRRLNNRGLYAIVI